LDPVLDCYTDLLTSLGVVSRQLLKPLPANYRFTKSAYRTAQSFLDALSGWLSRVYLHASKPARAVLAIVGVTSDPFEQVPALLDPARTMRLCHGDLNPTNCLWDGQQVHFLDWELALWGDPVWDLAAFLHRFEVPTSAEERLIEAVLTLESPFSTSSFLTDLANYRWLEVQRSVVIDGIRLTQAWGTYPAERIGQYVEKVERVTGVHMEEDYAKKIIELLE
jgi:thiamine kinase-like enzyme